ncbi:hypothetical protein [Streptomyces spiralis]
MGLPTYRLLLLRSRMGVFLGLAALTGLVAALWPAGRAARLNIARPVF